MRLLLTFAALAAVPMSAAAQIGPTDVDALPSSPPTVTLPYGSDSLQVGDLRIPQGKGPFPVVVLIHGGCWTRGYARRQNLAALATALQARGIATWNIEYRQQGDAGGGYPGMFLDWSRATDALRDLAKNQPIDLKRVVVAGHSAGGHGALWIAARPRVPRTSDIATKDPLPVTAAVDIDGPGDLAPFVGFDAEVCGRPVIEPMMGGSIKDHLDRYKAATPYDLLPIGVPQYLVSAAVLSPDAAAEYKAHATAAGDKVSIVRLENSGHFEPIAPGTPQEKQVEDLIVSLMNGGR